MAFSARSWLSPCLRRRRAVAAQASRRKPTRRRSSKWSFAGPFGKYDRGQLQRGFKVYREVCQICHGLALLSFRNLAEPGGPGFTPAQAAAIAAEYQVQDEPDDQGEVKERPGRLADRFPPPFTNDNRRAPATTPCRPTCR